MQTLIVVDSPRTLPPAAAKAWRSRATFARTARPYETAVWDGGSPVLLVSRSTPDVLERAVADTLQAAHLGSRDHPVLIMRPLQLAWTLLGRAQSGGELHRRLHGLGGLGVLQLVCNVLAGRSRSRPEVGAMWVNIRDFTRTWLKESRADDVPDAVRTLMRRMVTGTVDDEELAEAMGVVLSEPPPRGRSAMAEGFTPVGRPPAVTTGARELLPVRRPTPSTRRSKERSPGRRSSRSAAMPRSQSAAIAPVSRAVRPLPGPGRGSEDARAAGRAGRQPMTASALLAQVGKKLGDIKEPDVIYYFDYDLPDDARGLPVLLATRHGGTVRAVRVPPSVAALFRLLAFHEGGSITDDQVEAETELTATRKIVGTARKALEALGFPGALDAMPRDRTLKSYSTEGLWPVLLPDPRERERPPPRRVRES